jgi:hypothetical protein
MVRAASTICEVGKSRNMRLFFAALVALKPSKQPPPAQHDLDPLGRGPRCN